MCRTALATAPTTAPATAPTTVLATAPATAPATALATANSLCPRRTHPTPLPPCLCNCAQFTEGYGKLKIVVTGAGGFIASHLARRLKAEGHFVRAVDWKENEYMSEKVAKPPPRPYHVPLPT